MRTSYIFCIQGNRYIHSLFAILKLMVFNAVYRRILSLHCVQMIISTKFGFQTKHRHVQSCVRISFESITIAHASLELQTSYTVKCRD